MAKQIINVGTVANDGTGDPIRSAMTKTNENFTEVYTLINDIVVPTVPTELTDLGIADGTVGQLLQADGDGTFSFTTFVASNPYTDASVNTHLNTATGSAGEVLSWTGSDYDWVAQTVAYTDASVNTHLNTGAASAGEVLSWTGSDYDWIAAGGSGLQTRGSPSQTTASLANNTAGNLNITGYKTYALLSIITNKAAWIRIYVSDAARTADASRSEGTDPAPDAGVIAEVITTGAQTVLVSPGVIGYNHESPVTTTIPCAVTNKSGSTGTVLVSLELVQLEA